MLNRNFRKSLVLVSILGLGGCKVLDSLHLTGNSHRAQPAQAVLVTGPYGPATQAGRDNLRANQTGLAIEAFNRALASGEEPAAAYNGLGVGYARLGRPDLAYRFFSKAAASDPGNLAYARNLTNLVDSPAFTLNVMTRAAPIAAAAAERTVAATTAARAAVPAQVPGKLFRDSNRQFSLITAVPGEQAGSAAMRSATLDQCKPRSKARPQQHCGLIPLPQVQSRSARTGRVALMAPVAAQAQPAVDLLVDKSPSDPEAQPAGKAKTFELSRQRRGATPVAAARAPASAPASAPAPAGKAKLANPSTAA